MQAFGEAFYGRSAAYDLALTEGIEMLAQALCKNILNGREIENARGLAQYVGQSIRVLDGLDEAALRAGSWKFPTPARIAETA